MAAGNASARVAAMDHHGGPGNAIVSTTCDRERPGAGGGSAPCDRAPLSEATRSPIVPSLRPSLRNPGRVKGESSRMGGPLNGWQKGGRAAADCTRDRDQMEETP